jgi:phage tail-like protein
MKRTFSRTLIVVCGTVLITVALLGPGRLWGQRIGAEAALAADTTSFEFALQLDGEIVGFFHKCTGLVSASDVYEETVLTEGGLQIDQKRPGSRLLWEDITLTRSVGASDPVLWQWREQIENDNWDEALQDGQIILYGPGGETARWYFTNGWPVRLSANESVEKVTIAHDGLHLVSEATTRSRTR